MQRIHSRVVASGLPSFPKQRSAAASWCGAVFVLGCSPPVGSGLLPKQRPAPAVSLIEIPQSGCHVGRVGEFPLLRCGHGESSDGRRTGWPGNCRRASSERWLRAGLSLATGSRRRGDYCLTCIMGFTPRRPVPVIWQPVLSNPCRGEPIPSHFVPVAGSAITRAVQMSSWTEGRFGDGCRLS